MQYLFSINGRINRLQWWLGGLVTPLIWLAAFVIIGESIGKDVASTPPGRQLLAHAALLGAFFVSLWINFCLAVKRFHDRGKSGWWYLIILVPFIGTIWMLIELGLLAGDYGTNEYGPEPGSASASDLEAELSAMYGHASTTTDPRGATQPGTMPATSARPHHQHQPVAFGRAPARVSFGQRSN